MGETTGVLPYESSGPVGVGLLFSAHGLMFSRAQREAFELYRGVVGGSVRSPLERASAWRDIISRLVACRSASRSSAACRLGAEGNGVSGCALVWLFYNAKIYR